MASFNDENMGENVRRRLKKCGDDVKIYPLAKIAKPEVIEIGDHSQIDDFTFIYGGKDIKIGRYVHIASFCSIYGGGKFIMEDFSGLSSGCRIITGSDDFSGLSLTNAAVPPEFKNVIQSFVKLEKHAILGANVVVLPGLTVGEGAAIGACSLVTKDVTPWTINVGIPTQVLKNRPKEKILELEAKLYEKYGK